MSQLMKSGTYVFGWSMVRDEGEIVIPPEAYLDYHFMPYMCGILLPEGEISGGFGIISLEALRRSPFADMWEDCQELAELGVPEGEAITYQGKTYARITLTGPRIAVPVTTLKKYGIAPGNPILAVRESHIVLGFMVRGPIVEEARSYRGLDIV